MIPLNDLQRHCAMLKPVLEAAWARVLESGWYILGPEVEAFEAEYAEYCGRSHCIGVANGTDALEIGLRALGIGEGDEVVTVANAGMYSTTAIRAIGAVPVYAEIDPVTMILDPGGLPGLITARTRAVVVTHLYGRMAHLWELEEVASRYGLALVEDCAQAHGAEFKGQRAGSWGDIGCFSFYPTKNLGALGDGGAIVTSDRQVARRARQLRQYGWEQKYAAKLAGGRNSRLDEVQAAVLRAKLPYVDGWNQRRVRIAAQYRTGLSDTRLHLPAEASVGEMIYHLYVVRSPKREQLRQALQAAGIGCDVHYPVPDHLQTTCADLGYSPGVLPETELAATEVLSLPCFPELRPHEVQQVVHVLRMHLGAATKQVTVGEGDLSEIRTTED